MFLIVTTGNFTIVLNSSLEKVSTMDSVQQESRMNKVYDFEICYY